MRNDWKFSYPIHVVLRGAKERREHHQSRYDWWDAQKGVILAQIKESGLKISESLVSTYAKSGYVVPNAQLSLDPELQKHHDECLAKMRDHKAKRDQYESYVQVLASRPPNDQLELDVDDWIFFFGW